MNPIKFVTGLISKKSGLNNERITSQVNSVRDSIVNQTIPQADKITRKLAGDSVFDSEVYKLYNETIRNGVQTNIRGNMFVIIKAALDASVTTLSLIDKFIASDFKTETNVAGLTLAKANVIQLLDTVNLVGTYSRSLMDVVLAAEENRLVGEGRRELEGVTEAEVQYLAQARDAYIRGLNLVLTPADRIEDKINAIPEIVVSEIRSAAVTSVHGDDKLDPLRFGLFESKFDPIWLIGNMWIQYQYNRYMAAKETAAVIDLRIDRIRSILDKKPNPHLAGVLVKREGQRDLLRGKVKKMERQWDV